MLSGPERHFLDAARVAHLATADEAGAPHVVPVCFAVDRDSAYIPIDDKPKRRGGRPLKRLRNIAVNPKVALVADRYDDADWSRLGWVIVRGRAELLTTGTEHASAQALMCDRYRQLASMNIARHPVIAIRIERVTSWGDLGVTGC
jgi:PPOX class probable F420-dependent enzyme